MKIIYSPKCLEYLPLASPELPGRVKECAALLQSKNYEFIEPEPATEADILKVHTQNLIDQVKTEGELEADKPGQATIFDYALLAAGGAITAAELTAADKNFNFSLMRPPGHHAGKDYNGGFCYFNNMAVAVAKLLDRFTKIAILDIDCHHGDGTQNIFFGNDKVLYVSLHQVPLFPGTGLRSAANCLNYPLPPGTDEERYLEILQSGLKQIYDWQPQLLGVSLGLDTYKNDPLADIKLDISSYGKIAQLIKGLNLPTFAVFEGGYNEKEMPLCLESFLQEFKK